MTRALETAASRSHVTAMAWLITVTNAWATSFCMHESDQLKCLFGCDADDKLEHYFTCHALWSILDEAFGGNLTPNPFARINFDTPSIIHCILIECAFEIYHALKLANAIWWTSAFLPGDLRLAFLLHRSLHLTVRVKPPV